MSHNQSDPFSTQRKQTERDPRGSFSGERLGPGSSAGLSHGPDRDAISMLVHSCRQRVNTSQDIYAPKQNDRGQDLERYSQNINRHSDVGHGSAIHLSDYSRTSTATSSNYYQPSISAERSTLTVPSEKNRNLGSIPCRLDGEPDMNRSSEHPQPNYTAETAADILLKFGLQHEDLEHLFSYPEDQLTPENLPFILQQIRIKKGKKASEASCSKPVHEPAPDRDHAGGDKWRHPGLAQKDTPSPLHQSSNTIDYRNMDKYASRMEENVQGGAKRAEDDSLLTIDDLGRSCSQDLAQQLGKSKNSDLDQQTSSFFSSIPRSAPPKSSDSVKPAQSTKSHALKSSDFKQAQPVFKLILKPKAPRPILRPVSPSKPDLMVLGGDDTSSSCDPFKNVAPASDNKSKKQQMPSQCQNIKKKLSQKEAYTQKPPKVKKTQQPPSKPQQPSQKHPPVPNPAIKRHLLPNPTFLKMEKQQVHHIPSFMSSQPYPFYTPGPSSGVAQDLKPVQERVFQDVPTAELMVDYTATTPKVFPHLCSLCNKECANLKDWLTHQNTNFHLENCKVLRRQYPRWDGKMVDSSQDEPNNDTPPSEVQNKKSHHGSHSSSGSVTSRRRRSRSSEARKEKRPRRRTRSRSPKSSRYQRSSRSPTSRSTSRSYSSNASKYRRSRSRSYERRPSRRSPARHSSSRSSHEKRSSTQKRSSSPSRHENRSSTQRRSSSPNWDENRSFTQRRSSSPSWDENWSFTQRTTSSPSWDENWSFTQRTTSSPCWDENWSFTQRRSLSPASHENWSFTQRRSSSPNSHENWSFTQKRSSSPSCHENRRSPKRSRERCSPAKWSHDTVATPQTCQELSTEEDRLVKKLMKTSVVQSLSKQTDLEAMVKTLAPALLAELAKMDSTSSEAGPAETSTAAASSSAANAEPVVGKTSYQLAPALLAELPKMDSTSSEAKPAETSTAAASFSAANAEPVVNKTSYQQKLASANTKSVKKSFPTIVTLKDVPSSITYEDIVTAVEVYGIIESVVLFPQKSQAIVCFESLEDADKMRKEHNIKIRGFHVSVQEQKEGLHSLQKHNPQNFLRNPPSLAKVPRTQTSKITSVAPSAQTKAKTKPKTRTLKQIPKRAKLNPTCEDTFADLEDSRARWVKDAVHLQRSKVPLKAVVAPLLYTDEAATMDPVENPDVDLVLKEDARAGFAKDAVPPQSSDVPLKGVVAPIINSDEAATVDLVKTHNADVALKEDATRYQINARPYLHNSDVTLTIGERMCEFLRPTQIEVLGTTFKILHTKKFLQNHRQLVIYNLPVDQHSYCVQDIVQLFESFGFQSSAHKIYVLPQSRMAFVELDEIEGAIAFMQACKTNTPTLKDQKLEIRVLKSNIPMWPRRFYQWMMNWANIPVEENCPRTIFIKSITPSEIASLREALRKIGGVKNFLPLHNKVFVELESDYGADLVGVWYSLQNPCPAYHIYRLNMPQADSFTRQTFPKEAMPDLTFAGATVETCTFGIPELTLAPFYLTMGKAPFLFLTVSPWFIIPEFLTVKKEDDIQEARRLGASPTIMLTNLPEESFKHEDVAKLAWPYFSQKDLRSLYYNVIVLPLQRRAFVHFSDWDACCSFVRCHLGVCKFRVNRHCLALHFVLQPMCAPNNEENMYKSLMQLSNSRIGEVESLADRLLSVKIDFYKKRQITQHLCLITSHGEVVNFLPLANRICIEMADTVGVSRVLEEFKRFQSNAKARDAGTWEAPQIFESIESLNRRLQDPTVLTLDLSEDREYRSIKASPFALPTAVGQPTEEDWQKTESCPSLHNSDVELTIGERMCQFLFPHNFDVVRDTDVQEKIFAGKCRQLLISNLPVDQHSYCVQDVIKLVKPFGFDVVHDNIYVLPQLRMAFVRLRAVTGVARAMKTWKTRKPFLKSQKLEVQVPSADVPMWPMSFYHWVMRQMNFPVEDRCSRTILIKDITLSEMASLREVLRTIGGVINFLPLHDRVFVEFKSEMSADHFGVWYMLHDQCPAYSIHRLVTPQSVSVPPKVFPNEAMPDLAFAGATVETCTFGIPELTLSPFYLTMGKKPFLFLTVSPWFIIPEFLTVKEEGDIKAARQLGATPTIMLTNLPEESFKHEDIASLAWPYISQKNLRSLYYNVIVLPLQRRAFVHFSDWDACCSFVRFHLRVRTCKVNGHRLALHFLLRPMPVQNTEENMYRSLMQLSNSRTGQVESLAERLLSVEIPLYRKNNITQLLHVIAGHGDIVNFLPLANRICIEMADSQGVERVLQSFKNFQRHPQARNAGSCKAIRMSKRKGEVASRNATKMFKRKLGSWKLIFNSIDSLNLHLQDPTVFTLDRNEYMSMKASSTATPSNDSEQPAKEHVSESQGEVMVTQKDCEKTEGFPALRDSDVVPNIWERMWKSLPPHMMAELRRPDLYNKIFEGKQTQLLISKLPFDERSYCVQDIIQLVKSFGVDSSVEMIYVLPQSRMALVQVTRQEKAFAAFNSREAEMLTLKEQGLDVRVLRDKVPMWPAGFYKWLMIWSPYCVGKKRSRTIFIQGVTPSETASLRKALQKIGSVKMFLPLHDKVFVEFESDISADRLGVWYNLHHQCPAYSIYRLDIPEGVPVASQMCSNEAMPDLAFAGATFETCPFGIPELTKCPFYMTMKAKPFLFSTANPWFIIPEFLTVENQGGINEARQLGASPTIMLTNLPEDCLRHKDVAKLAWPYFSQKDLRSLYYNVIVLPLQKRAFLHFSDWDACCRFVQYHLDVGPFRLNGRQLGLHFVLQPMPAQNTEENMYRSLMKLSNSRIGEVESLAQRLLCVKIGFSKKDIIKLLLHLISGHAEVVNFLPLANRICVEMADSSGVAHVIEESKHFSVSPRFRNAWKAIKKFESIESLNRRLQDSTEITLDLFEDRSNEVNPPAPGEPSVEPMPTATPSLYSEQPIAGLMSESQGVEMATEEDCQKTECSIPEVQDDKENVSEEVEDGPLSASPYVDNETLLPTVGSNNEAAVQKEEALPVEDPLVLGKDETLVEREDPLVENNNVALCDQQPLDIDDFVKISDDGDQEDSSEAPSHSKRPCSPPDSKQNKTRASKESKNSKSSSTASSRTTRSSSRRILSSGTVSSPVRHSTRAQSKAKKSNDSSQGCLTHQTRMTCEEENLLMVLGDEQKPLSDEKRDLSEDGPSELQEVSKQGNKSQVENAEKEQTAPVDVPNLEEQNESQRGKEMIDMKEDVDKEHMAESRSAIKDVVEDQPSVNLDSYVREVKEHTAFSEHKDKEEELDAYQEIDSVEDQRASTDNHQSVSEPSMIQECKGSLKKQEHITAKTPEPEKYLVVVDSSNTPVLGRRQSIQIGKEMTDMKEDVDKEQMAESRSAMKDVVEDQPSVDLDSHVRDVKEYTAFSEHKDKAEEADAYQEIDSEENQQASTDNEQGLSEPSKIQESKEYPDKQEHITAKTPEPEKYLMVDSVQANSSSNTPVSGRRRSTRGKTQEQTAKTYVPDSLEEDACITTRATRKRGRPPKKGIASEEEDTVLRTTSASSTSPETAKKKAPINVVVIEEPTNEIQDHIKDPAPKRKGRKGRPMKGVKTMKIEQKDTADDDEEAATFEVMDSLEDMTATRKTQSSPKKENVTDRMPPVKLEVEKEAKYQVVDSLGEDRTREEMSATEVCGSGKTGEPQTDLEVKATSCENKLEVDIKEPSQMETETQQHAKKDDTSQVTSTLTPDQVGHVEEQSRTDHERILTSEDLKKTEEASPQGIPLEDEEALSDGQHSQASLQKLDKQTGELVRPPRSESPFRPTDFVLPSFDPDNPLGTEFVKPKSGFLCEVCSVFYLQESTAKELHCRSRTHYNNLKKHYSKCEKDSSASTEGTAVSY
ncbi:uncharacterized protein LOC130928919 [Corythoichthys intestinalis]|uniref:uncharacterized protein LOC130928919 n=1 Tax=Corythoichthys intestinalis TaxID=161448 RepID=UPI0025A4EFFF|nr:uncharacterized protein LOC130928919 [Corythoichthys intestinalis]XP_057711724.1 uncharacterized protein LOC130928919 [Corythoichthys intestinalis]